MKLKPCPFCGEEAKAEPFEEEGLSSNFHPARVICKDFSCGASMEKISFKPYEENIKVAAERWNRREKPKSKYQ